MTQISLATGLVNSSFVTNTSRYINSPIIYWGPKQIVTFETYKRQSFTPSSNDQFLVVNSGEEFRPDLVAIRAYGTSFMDFWWYIMQINGVYDVFDLRAGLTLRIPPITSAF